MSLRKTYLLSKLSTSGGAIDSLKVPLPYPTVIQTFWLRNATHTCRLLSTLYEPTTSRSISLDSLTEYKLEGSGCNATYTGPPLRITDYGFELWAQYYQGELASGDTLYFDILVEELGGIIP